MIRLMVEALSGLGHHAASRSEETWATVSARVSAEIEASDHLFLVAEEDGELAGLLEARLETPHAVFQPKRLLHVSAVFVEPSRRRRGWARQLLAKALEWGRDRGCADAQLNTLVSNPARGLFASLGFREVEVRMIRPLAR